MAHLITTPQRTVPHPGLRGSGLPGFTFSCDDDEFQLWTRILDDELFSPTMYVLASAFSVLCRCQERSDASRGRPPWLANYVCVLVC